MDQLDVTLSEIWPWPTLWQSKCHSDPLPWVCSHVTLDLVHLLIIISGWQNQHQIMQKVITFPHTNKIMEIIREVHLKTRSKGQDLECCQPRIWLEHLWSVMFLPTTENFASPDNFNHWRRKYLNLLQDSERDISVNNLLMSILRPAFHLQTIILVKIYIRREIWEVEQMFFCRISIKIHHLEGNWNKHQKLSEAPIAIKNKAV